MSVIKAVLFFGFGSLILLWLLGPPSSGGKLQRVEVDFQVIHSALKTYVTNAGQPPTTAQGLDALVNEPRSSPKPKRWVQVMKIFPADPWETPYRYVLVAPKEREWRWELRSAGPDRVFGNRDDLTSEEESGDLLTLQDGSRESHPSY